MATSEDLFSSIAEDTAAEVAAVPSSSKKKRKTLALVDRPPTEAEEKKETKAAVGDLIAGDGRALPAARLGSVVFWSADEISVKPWPLYDAIVAVDEARPTEDRPDGIDFDFVGPAFADLVPAPSPVGQAARRALSRRQQGLPDLCRWQDVGDADGHTVIALTSASANAKTQDWKANARWFVRFRHSDGVVVAPDDLDDEEAAALDSLVDRYQKERANLTAQDIGRILVTAIIGRLRGFRVKAGGGVYFVPRPLDANVDRLAGAFALAGVYLRRCPVLGDDAAQFKGDAEDSLVEDATRILEEAKAASAKLQAATEKKGRPRAEAVYRRLKDIEEIQARATAYGALLGALRVNVDDALKEAKAASSKTLDLLSTLATMT